MNNSVVIYRKRHIPNEVIKLKDDVILEYKDNIIVTSWKCIRSRDDISRGVSAYYINKGYKVSKLYDANDNLVYWYCDIMKISEQDTIDNNEKIKEVFYEDMLLDVIIYPDNTVRVVDADEFAYALEKNMITKEEAILALKNMNDLLELIYSGGFCKIQEFINEKENINK